MSILDANGRVHQYLRISITEACNLRCIYCRPEDEAETYRSNFTEKNSPDRDPTVSLGSSGQTNSLPSIGRTQTMPYEHCIRIVQMASRFGFRKVRITGGEPLLHPDIERIVQGVVSVPGIEDVSLTTNGTLISDRIRGLKEAGLQRINISLDSLNPETYARITRRATLFRVLEGIEAALKADLHPVKLNVVLLKGINDGEIPDFLAFARDNPVHVRFIECMPFLPGTADLFISTEIVKERARELGLSLIPVQGKGYRDEKELHDRNRRLNEDGRIGDRRRLQGEEHLSDRGCLDRKSPLDGPAELFKISGGKGLVGLIHPVSRHFCSQCNRLRVTASGSLRPCLLQDYEVPLGSALSDPEKTYEVFRKALELKESHHSLTLLKEKEVVEGLSAVRFSQSRVPAQRVLTRRMYAIGG